jgi:hypothetical protein
MTTAHLHDGPTAVVRLAANQGEVADAIQRVQRRVVGALAGNVGRDTTVCIGQLGRDDAPRAQAGGA